MQERLHQFVDPNLLHNFQVIPSRVRKLDPRRKSILWLHDLHGDPEVQHLADGGWEKYDKLVFVSHWQQQMYNAYLGIPFSAGTVLKNAIVPIEAHTKPDDKIRLIYFSTPHRGLDILYPVFEQIAKEHSNVELNVFSSFKLYGWPERDKPFKELFKKMIHHPQINYHKSVSNEVIREELKKSHILAYPSTWVETSCLVLIESMSAGLLNVHSSLGALPETASNLNMMYDYHEDKNVHAQRFYSRLKTAISLLEKPMHKKSIQENLANSKAIADTIYSWSNRKVEWNNLLRELMAEDSP